MHQGTTMLWQSRLASRLVGKMMSQLSASLIGRQEVSLIRTNSVERGFPRRDPSLKSCSLVTRRNLPFVKCPVFLRGLNQSIVASISRRRRVQHWWHSKHLQIWQVRLRYIASIAQGSETKTGRILVPMGRSLMTQCKKWLSL